MSSPEATNVDALVHALEAAHELTVSAAKVAEAFSGRSSRVAKGSRSLADETAAGTPQRETVEGLCGQIDKLAEDVSWILRAHAPGRGSITTAAEVNGAYTAVVDAVERFVVIADRVSTDHAEVPAQVEPLKTWFGLVGRQLAVSTELAEEIRRAGVERGLERAQAIQASPGRRSSSRSRAAPACGERRPRGRRSRSRRATAQLVCAARSSSPRGGTGRVSAGHRPP